MGIMYGVHGLLSVLCRPFKVVYNHLPIQDLIEAHLGVVPTLFLNPSMKALLHQ